VQHLKVEGVFVRDDGGYLRDCLSRFQPADSYIEELKDALVPATWSMCDETGYWARLCVGDILFVAIRNAAILHAATGGRHIYDYTLLIEHVVDAFGLSEGQRTALLELRAIKAAYRARQAGVDVGTSLRVAIGAMRLVQGAVLDLGTDRDNGFVPNRYHALRRKELELVRLSDPRDLDRLDPSDARFALWQLVCNPADYPKLRAASRTALPDWLQTNDHWA
jgi:hypothetical protein